MKSSRVRVLIALAVILALLLLAWTMLEAQRQRRQVEETLTVQAALLSQSLSPALASASDATLESDEMISWRLLDNARLLAELWSNGLVDPERLEELVEASGLDSALFFRFDGQLQLEVGESIPAPIVGQLDDLITGRAKELVVGSSLENGVEHLGAAATGTSGDVVLVRIHPSSARSLVQRLGVDHLLDTLVGSGGVLYLSYHEEPGGMVAEASWDNLGVPGLQSQGTRPFDVRGQTVIEMATSVETQAGTHGTLRIGLDASALQREGVAIMRRTLLVGLVLFAFAVSASGYAVVSHLRARDREQAAARFADVETARRRSERLAAAGALAAGLAHEVRSPLNAIGLAAQRLERKLPALDPSREIAGRIRGEVSRLEEVLRGFLELASPVSDRREVFDLAGQVQQVLDLLEDEAESHAVTLRRTGGLISVVADRDSIHRAIVNLVRNAIQASPEGSSIEVQVGNRSDRAILRVIDQGPGIDPAVRGREFDPFVTGRASGTGLGLALVRRVAEEHGGSARLVCHEAGGTMAELILPGEVGAES
jgi:signal transduction histidine kinase